MANRRVSKPERCLHVPHSVSSKRGEGQREKERQRCVCFHLFPIILLCEGAVRELGRKRGGASQ